MEKKNPKYPSTTWPYKLDGENKPSVQTPNQMVPLQSLSLLPSQVYHRGYVFLICGFNFLGLCLMCKMSLLLFNLVWRFKICENFSTFITSSENSSKCYWWKFVIFYANLLISFELWYIMTSVLLFSFSFFGWEDDGSAQPNRIWRARSQ